MAYTLYNPANPVWGTGASFYTVGGVGSKSGEFTSVSVKGGAVMGIKNTSNPSLDGVTLGKSASVNLTNNTSYRGLNNGVSAAFLGTSLTATVIGNSGGYCAYSGTAGASNVLMQALTVGSWVTVNPSTAAVAPGSSLNLLYSTQSISNTGTYVEVTGVIITNLPYQPLFLGQTVAMNGHTTTYDWNTMTKGRYIVQKYTPKLAGVNITNLAWANSNYGQLTRSINKVESVRTTKLCTGLRAGYFNKLTGKWTTAPTIASDGAITNSTITSDAAAAPTAAKPGELTYKTGKPTPWTNALDGVTAYSARTTW